MTGKIAYSKEQIRCMADAVRNLQAAGFTTIAEATVYFALAEDQLGGDVHDVTAVAALAGVPLSTASRIAWRLQQRGLLSHDPDPADRRSKVIRAILEFVPRRPIVARR